MVRAALVQFSGHESKEINVRKAEDLARQAAGSGARIICFPELATTIYFCFGRDRKWFETAEPIPGPSVERLARVARETGTVIVYPLYERDGDTLYNTATVLGPDGNLIGKYRKMSVPQILRTVKAGETPADERFFFAPGNLGFPVFDTPFGVTLGVLICYDRHFPEAARTLGLKGAHLMLVPTATYRDWIREVWEVELRAHAIANMFYVGGVNKVGPDVGCHRVVCRRPRSPVPLLRRCHSDLAHAARRQGGVEDRGPGERGAGCSHHHRRADSSRHRHLGRLPGRVRAIRLRARGRAGLTSDTRIPFLHQLGLNKGGECSRPGSTSWRRTASTKPSRQRPKAVRKHASSPAARAFCP